MSPTWNCFRCQTANASASRHCSSCGAVRPPVAQAPPGLDEAFAEALASTLASTSSGTPRSDMLAGLEALVQQVDSGAMSPEAFGQKMHQASVGLDEVFTSMEAELLEVPEADLEYTQAVETGLEVSRGLFRLALAELESFSRDCDHGHLRVGLLVAEKAEEHYQGLLDTVREDAVGHRFGGEADLVRRLAGAVLEGVLPVHDYQERLGQLQGAVEGWLAEATRLLETGFRKAREFDGVNPEVAALAGQDLESACRELGRVILALHDPESTREAARQVLHDEAIAEGLD